MGYAPRREGVVGVRSRSAANREDGAILLIVAVMLVVLFGILLLVVDLGMMVAQKRVMVRAADSSALAAAISCATREGEAAAIAQADFYAQSNGEAEIVPGYPHFYPSCDAPSGMVRIEVRYRQELLFAPALGLGREGLVVARATAMWGGSGVGEHMAPVMVNADRLGNCNIPEETPPKDCTFWWDNSPASASDPALANAEWGTLDLTRWNVAKDAQCSNSTPPQFEEWMFVGYFLPLEINKPGPTYVCRGQGNFGASLDKLLERAITADPPLELHFPVNRPEGQVDKDGNPCPPGTAGCSPDKYDIIGFARMIIREVWKGNTPEAYDLCISRIPGAEKDANARCMVARWVGFSTEGLNPNVGENFGDVPVQLIE